jgi:hypothetical protein
MTNRSDCELQKWIQFHPILDYTDEEVQKKIIVSQDHGASITLYDWIHRHDNTRTVIILEADDNWWNEVNQRFSDEWLAEFRKAFSEDINK